MKNREGPISITTGYRTWEDQTSTGTLRQSETVFEYTFFDFGIEEIVPPEPVVDELECDEPCPIEEDDDTIFGIDKLYVFIAGALLAIIIILIIICCCCFGKNKGTTNRPVKFGKDPDSKPVTVGPRASRAASAQGGTDIQLADQRN